MKLLLYSLRDHYIGLLAHAHNTTITNQGSKSFNLKTMIGKFPRSITSDPFGETPENRNTNWQSDSNLVIQSNGIQNSIQKIQVNQQ